MYRACRVSRNNALVLRFEESFWIPGVDHNSNTNHRFSFKGGFFIPNHTIVNRSWKLMFYTLPAVCHVLKILFIFNVPGAFIGWLLAILPFIFRQNIYLTSIGKISGMCWREEGDYGKFQLGMKQSKLNHWSIETSTFRLDLGTFFKIFKRSLTSLSVKYFEINYIESGMMSDK